MRNTKIILLIASLSLPGLSGDAQEKVDTAMMARIREEGLHHSQVRAIAHQITDVAGPIGY